MFQPLNPRRSSDRAGATQATGAKPAGEFSYGFEGIAPTPIRVLPRNTITSDNLPVGVEGIQTWYSELIIAQLQIPYAGFSGFCAYGSLSPNPQSPWSEAVVIFTRGYRHARVSYAMLARDGRDAGYVTFYGTEDDAMHKIDVPATVGASWVEWTAPAGQEILAVGFLLPPHAVVDNIILND